MGRPPFRYVHPYPAPEAALAWLDGACEFKTTMAVTGDSGGIGHAEMTCGSGYGSLGGEWDGLGEEPSKSTKHDAAGPTLYNDTHGPAASAMTGKEAMKA